MNGENSNSPLKRNMKVYYQHYDNSYIPHPLIRLRGKYLAEFGFNVGDTIAVDVDVGQITIKKVQQEIPCAKPE